MENYVYLVLCTLLGIGIGLFIGRSMLKKVYKKQEEEAEEKAKLIVKEAELTAENLKKDRILEAKEKYLKLKAEFEDDVNKKKQIIITNENKLKQREQASSRRSRTCPRPSNRPSARRPNSDTLKEDLAAQLDMATKRREEAERLRSSQVEKLEKLANLTAEEARNQLVEALKDEAQSRASGFIKNIVEEAKLTATKEAKKVVIETIQRTATENAIENCVSVFNIESDDVKGKIIGREGRNIRALEAATGVEIIVDDTPEAIIISGFDPVRREIARLSLHRLVQDGRIHPARIEKWSPRRRKTSKTKSSRSANGR
jgi:ribonuclease Y